MVSINQKVYRNDLDLLKGFAILGVVLYHLGISRSGYLGVDAFFVINGFFIIPKVVGEVTNGRFSYFNFLEKRIVRLLPLILLISFLSLIVGYWGMLPDDYENLSESVIASNFFSNNILASITTKNYWDVVNDYKPLMHTWYIGILIEFYLLFPLIVVLVKYLSQKLHFGFYKYVVITLISLSIISLLLFLNPSTKSGDRFYLIQYRFFELAFGGLAGMWIRDQKQGKLYQNGLLSTLGFVILLLVMFVGIIFTDSSTTEYNLVTGAGGTRDPLIPQSILLLLTVILTTLFIVSDNIQSRLISLLVNARVFCLLGAMSYSVYIWHQPVLAFYRYFISNEFSPYFVLAFFVIVFSLSIGSFRLVEQKVKVGTRTRAVSLAIFLLVNGIAFALFTHAGVVRDVPELDVKMNSVHRSMHAEYVDRIYAYNREFPTKNGKTNVLVIGDSFARDWANILLESEIADKINLSYANQVSEKHIERIQQADLIFIHGWKHNVPAILWENINPSKVWGVGTKNFGDSNGIIYKNRRRANYFQQRQKIKPIYIAMNEMMKKEWKDKHIDLLDIVLVENNEVVCFSDEHKFISQDTRHLTRGGARYYAKQIDFCKIFDASPIP